MSETVWLVELECSGSAQWVGIIDGKPQWTTDANKALRFSRKEDSDAFKSWWCMTATSTGHTWCDV